MPAAAQCAGRHFFTANHALGCRLLRLLCGHRPRRIGAPSAAPTKRGCVVAGRGSVFTREGADFLRQRQQGLFIVGGEFGIGFVFQHRYLLPRGVQCWVAAQFVNERQT